MGSRGRSHDDAAGGRASQAAGGEVKRDGVGEVVRQIRKRGDPIDGRGGQGALQGAAAGAASRRDHGAVVAGAQVAKRVFDADDRLLREGHTGSGATRRLRLDRQRAGRTRIHRDAGGGRVQSATGEIDRDGLRLGVGQIGEGRHAVDRGDAGRSLQHGCAQIERGRDHGAARGGQVAKGVQNPNRRRRRKRNARGYCGWLCLYGQTGGRARVHGEDRAQGTGQAGGAGGQLFARAGGINPQIGERGRAVAGVCADVKRRRSLQWTGSAGQTQAQIPVRPQARGRGIAELVLGADHRLAAENRTYRGVARLRGEGQAAGRRRAYGDRVRNRRRGARAGELDRDVACHVVREIGERDGAIRRRRHTGGPLQGAAARQARRRDRGAGHAVGRAAQVGKLIPDFEDRLLGKGHTRRRRRRRLRENDQAAGRTGDLAQAAEMCVGGKARHTRCAAAGQVAAGQGRA